MKILIAEDEALILQTLELKLKKEGYEVIGCVDGLDALQKIDSEQPDLIIRRRIKIVGIVELKIFDLSGYVCIPYAHSHIGWIASVRHSDVETHIAEVLILQDSDQIAKAKVLITEVQKTVRDH